MEIKGDHEIWRNYRSIAVDIIDRLFANEEVRIVAEETDWEDIINKAAFTLPYTFLMDHSMGIHISSQNIELDDLDRQRIKRKFGSCDENDIRIYALEIVAKDRMRRRLQVRLADNS